ncbi:MAG: hypothetical protein K9L22_10875, partial [Methylococcaceae bacterium]|nr:hypothetical protein [Methylococcaceae bacterium]
INSGGSYAAAKPSDEIITMAAKAQDLFGMSYTTVDVAETKHGAIVFEVSAFGGFRGAKEGLNQDVAAFYVEHVLAVLHNSQATLAAPISMHA